MKTWKMPNQRGRRCPLVCYQAKCLPWSAPWVAKEKIQWNRYKNKESKNWSRKGFICSLPRVSSSIKQRTKILTIVLRVEEDLWIHLKMKVMKFDLYCSANEISSTYIFIFGFCLLQPFIYLFWPTKGNSKTRKENKHFFSRETGN